MARVGGRHAGRRRRRLDGLRRRADARGAAHAHPGAAACQSQQHIEPLVERHLRALGVARIERGTALAAVAQAPDGIRATLRDADGAVRTVHADYLVGADGIRSTVREQLRIPASPPAYSGHRVVVQFRAPELWELLATGASCSTSWTTPRGPGTLIPSGRDDRWVYVRVWDPAGEELASYGPDRARGSSGCPPGSRRSSPASTPSRP
jgi:putative polyketide hydroxylase